MPPTSYFPNTLPSHGQPLDSRDAETLGLAAAERVRKVLSLRANHSPTPLHALPGLAGELGVASLHVKDEGFRLGLGSFKALGGAYALMILVREEASRRLGREVAVRELMSDEVRAVAATMTFACATDGNHGRSVAQMVSSRLILRCAVLLSRGRISRIMSEHARWKQGGGDRGGTGHSGSCQTGGEEGIRTLDTVPGILP